MQQPIKTIIVPIHEYGIVIEDEMGGLLLSSMPGLYTPASKRIYNLSHNRSSQSNSNESATGISNDDGRIVITIPTEYNAPKHERSKGTVGTCLVKDFVNSLIDNSLNWVETKIRFSDILDEYMIAPELVEQSQLCEERIRCILQDLTVDICNFIGQDNWYIYNTSQFGLDLKITKLEDFRIHEYMRLKKKGII